MLNFVLVLSYLIPVYDMCDGFILDITILNEENINGHFHVIYYLYLGMHTLSDVFTTCAFIYILLWLIDGVVVILYWYSLVIIAK